MAATDNGLFTMSIRDRGNKACGFSVNTEILTGANFAAMLTARDAFIDAIEDMIDGRIITGNLISNKRFGSGKSDVVDSSRAKRLMVFMRDNVNEEPYHFTVPTYKAFDADFKPGSDGDYIDLTTTWIATRIAAINAFARSPESAHDGTLTAIRIMK